MRFYNTKIQGVLVIEPDVHRDSRGYFLETYHASKYELARLKLAFAQDNQSCSVANALRGLHMQVRKPQGKLVRAVVGEIWDVAVDARAGSPTFGCWTAAVLSSDNFKQLYVPAGCLHGFCVMSASALVEYKCTVVYDANDEIGVAYDDPALAIDWPVTQPIVSARDKNNPSFANAMARSAAISELVYS